MLDLVNPIVSSYRILRIFINQPPHGKLAESNLRIRPKCTWRYVWLFPNRRRPMWNTAAPKIVFPPNLFSEPFSTKNPWLYGSIRTTPTESLGVHEVAVEKKSDVCEAHVSSRAAGKWRSIWCTRWRRHKFRQMPFVTRMFSANSRLFLKFSHGSWKLAI